MKKVFFFFISLVFILVNISMTFNMSNQKKAFNQKLSAYNFFKGDIKEQIPSERVYPYELNSPLFSDYAHKLRFIHLPSGTTVSYNPDSVFQFPIGTSIVKTFYYLNDERNDAKGRRLVETRVLIHESDGWKSLPYIWNEDQTEAYLEVAGGSAEISYRNDKGEKRQFVYTVPNMNQCKSCHERNGTMTPIGPSARQLNREHVYQTVSKNQLSHLADEGILNMLPSKLSEVPKLVNYNDPLADIDDRAKAYLDINCAHCHNKAGQAQTSGLYLDWKQTDHTAFGFNKSPIAAGRGSGDLKYDIVPGRPEESILLHRMKSTDPGVMMPELSRSLVHTEGVELIREWIKGMKQ
jgi:uncharacterized repeat protein (TIGR03806 family)